MNSSMEKPYVVGIDIGGTNTVFGIVDARGTIIASGAVKTQVYPTVEEYADEVCKNLLPLIIANGGVDKIKGIGIGAPNGNYYTGTIEFAPNLPWKGVLPLAVYGFHPCYGNSVSSELAEGADGISRQSVRC